MMAFMVGVYPPLFVNVHAGGRCYAMRFVRGEYREGALVFRGVDEANETLFSPGPGMHYAKIGPCRLRVNRSGRCLGTWKLKGEKVVTWWDLPIVVRGRRVDLLRPGGRLRRLPLEGQFLRTVLPGRSGALFALYSTKSHWRVLRRGREGDRWTPWLTGSAADFAPTTERLFVAVGTSAGSYKEYGASGPGSLWSYGYRQGDTICHRTLSDHDELAFDRPWVGEAHFASIMTYVSEDRYPARTELLGLGSRINSFGTIRSGWEAHVYDPAKRRFLGLHINRKNMGFDLCWFRLDSGVEQPVDDMVDAVDVSTASPYSPLVKG